MLKFEIIKPGVPGLLILFCLGNLCVFVGVRVHMCACTRACVCMCVRVHLCACTRMCVYPFLL